MPIRDSERARYPKDWPAISKRIRERAGNRCEQCNAPNGEVIKRFASEDYHWEPAYVTQANLVFSAVDGRQLGADYFAAYPIWKAVKVVLTVAHLDHTPENCRDENLKAWCQKCHLSYDAAHHAKNGKATRRARKASGDLFAVPAPHDALAAEVGRA